MKTENLHAVIDRYEERMDELYGPEHNELFKWRAMATWRRVWAQPVGDVDNFAERFRAAIRDFSLFTDGSRMHPSAGVIRMWEKDPERVEHLFLDVLLAPSQGSVEKVQEHFDTFLAEYEALRQKHFPKSWPYKQDPHAASVFLSMHEPDVNFVFKSSSARLMARYLDFGLDLGTGNCIRLQNYYQMCDIIVDALREHDTLLKNHFACLDDAHYRDESLHLLAFDLMYCAGTYSLYEGIEAPVKRSSSSLRKADEMARIEQEKREKHEAARKALQEELLQAQHALEEVSGEIEEISLMGVQVKSDRYGTGLVTEQTEDKIRVQFEKAGKTFRLHRKYPQLPHFEDDEVILEAFSLYGDCLDRVRDLENKLKAME
ncbi:MAG: hypothetical protein IJ083_12400 [Clostridia bacterium]|nr:hypothetical protein [Clostridia bacterium]